jgi:hypothetical protein
MSNCSAPIWFKNRSANQNAELLTHLNTLAYAKKRHSNFTSNHANEIINHHHTQP